MRHLTRRASEEYTYRFEHKWWVDEEVTCDETGDFYKSETSLRDLGRSTIWELTSNVNADFNSDEDFFVDLLNEKINEHITGIKLKLTADGKATWTITSSAELLDGDRKLLMDWLEGQCSDGYGEGLEMDPMYEFSDEEEEYFEDDEPDEEGYYGGERRNVQVDHRLFVRLYGSGFELKEI